MRSKINRVNLAMEYLADGRSIAWVAREFGFTSQQVSHMVGLLGLQGKRSSPPPNLLDKYDQVEQAILEQWPTGEICKTFKVDRSTVNKWFPDRPKMSSQEAGELAQLYQQHERARKKWRETNDWTTAFLGREDE